MPGWIGLMLVHGAAAGNFSPLNVLSLVVQQAAARGGHVVDPGRLFAANLVYNLALAAVIAALLGRSRPSVDPDRGTSPPADAGAIPAAPPSAWSRPPPWRRSGPWRWRRSCSA